MEAGPSLAGRQGRLHRQSLPDVMGEAPGGRAPPQRPGWVLFKALLSFVEDQELFLGEGGIGGKAQLA